MENSSGQTAKMREDTPPTPGDQADVGVLRAKQHLPDDQKTDQEEATPGGKSTEKTKPEGKDGSKEVKAKEQTLASNDAVSAAEHTLQKSKEQNASETEHSSSANHSSGLESDGLRHRTTASNNSDQLNNSQGDGKEEEMNGHLILEEFLDMEAEDEDEDSAWEDVDEDDDDQQDGENNQVCEIPYPGVYVKREPNPELPETVTTLTTPCGSKVFLVGTAHFSESSQEDVAKTIGATQPDIVMVELCNSRVNLLSVDEETLLEEAKNLNMEKVRTAIRQSGFVQGIMHVLLLSMSAHLTEQLGMAPGGEFRRAFKEAQKINGCRIRLGDRPIHITLRRALGSLSMWQKTRLAWYLITSKEPISKEEVEKCKEKDLLEEMLREMTGEFPQLSEVFVKERDLFLANSLKQAARPIPNPHIETGMQPAVVVGVVGIGHVPGIVENWEKTADIRELMRIPPASKMSIAMKWIFRGFLVSALTWSCYKLYRLGSHVVVSTYNTLPAIRNK